VVLALGCEFAHELIQQCAAHVHNSRSW
jgi:hypothetical protein